MNPTKKTFSLLLTTILGLNTVIGAGIFAMPLSLIKLAGPAGILSVALGGLCVLFIGLSFSRIANYFPDGGGLYTYIESWGGKGTGIIANAIYFLSLSTAMGLLVQYVSKVISVYMTSISISYIEYSIVIAVVLATLFASSVGSLGQKILLILTILPLLIIGGMGLSEFSLTRFYPFVTKGFSGIFNGMPVVLFSFLGFEGIVSFANKIENPGKNIPLAMLFTIIISGLVYVAFVGSIIGGYPVHLLAEKTVLSEVLLYARPDYNWIIHFINVSIIITILGTIYATAWTLTELLIDLVKKANKSKYQLSEVPALGLIGICMILAMKMFNNPVKAFNYIALTQVCVYVLTILYLFFKRKNFLDKFIGFFGLVSSVIIFLSALLQLI